MKIEKSKINETINENRIGFDKRIIELSVEFEKKYDTILDNENQLCKSVSESIENFESSINKSIDEHRNLINSKHIILSESLRYFKIFLSNKLVF